MTIDSSWIACLKEEAPDAFTSLPPFAPDAVFCDGQIKLMCPAVGELFTWADYIFRQFSRGLQRYLDTGTDCVVLAFDDYRHVPSAKYMTQVPVCAVCVCLYVRANCAVRAGQPAQEGGGVCVPGARPAAVPGAPG